MRYFTGYSILLLGLLAAEATATTLPRVDAAVKIDGDLSDPLWDQSLQIENFYDTSGANKEPPVRTIGFAAYDARFLYIAVHADDPDPRNIRAPHVPRDQVFGDQDLVQIDIDAQDDGKWSTIFRVNARGVQADGIYTESVGVDDFTPDFDWESATRITANAWEAEMRIPLASIRYAQRDPQTWRITFYRVYPREHRYRMRSFPFERGQTCWLCSAPRYEGVTGLGTARSLVVTPYVTTRAASPPVGRSEHDTDAGIDMKWLPRPSLSLDATIRPDFSQVEADVTQISVNERFAIFYPEKRPFFMEGSDLLSSPIQAIHTRTITSPLWGARLTGRPGNHAFTLIAAGDRAGGGTIVPGPAFSSLAPQPETLAILGRYRYSFGLSSAGFLFTSKSGDGYTNRVFGPDVLWWPRSADRVTAQFLVSDESAKAALVAWDRNSRHVAWNVTLKQIDRDFRADSGFLPQTGVRTAQANFIATAYPKRHFTSLAAEVVFDRAEEIGGGLVSQSLFPRVSFEGWRGMTGIIGFHPAEKVRARNGSVQSATYAKAILRFLPSRRFPMLSITAQQGEEVDVSSARVGDGTRLTLFGRLQPVNPLYVEITADRHRLDVDRARLFDVTALSTRLTWAFSARSFARLISDGQRITARDGSKDGFLDATILYGYRITWQTILYAGYGDSRVVDSAGRLGSPRKELFIKASYALRPGIGQ